MDKTAEPEVAVVIAEDAPADVISSGTSNDWKDMHRMGKKQQFRRNFRFVSIFGFAMILMSTWEAYLGTVGFGLANGGLAGMLYMYIAVAMLFFLVVVSLSEMASMAPTAGGQYHWVSEFAPRQFQRQLSFLVGWLCVLGWQSGVAISCFLSAVEIQGLVILNKEETYAPQRWHGTLMAIGVILFVALFNTVLAKHLPLVESLVLVLHLVGFVAIMVPLWVLGRKAPSREVWTNFGNAGGWSSTGLACLVGMASPIASFVGADAATHTSEELRDASKILPQAMVSTVIFNGLLGFVTVITFCYVVGDVEGVLTTKTGFPFIQVFYDTTGSKTGATLMTSIMIILSVLNALTNMASASRQLFAFARDKGVPCHAWLARVPPGWSIPLNAIVFTIFLPSILVLINIGSVVAFNQIVALGICALLSSYLISIGCVTLRRLRKQPLLASRYDLGRWGLLINLTSIAFLSIALVFSFFPSVAKPVPETMNWAIVVYGGVLSVAAVYYAFWGRFVYVGPVQYVRKSV